MQRARATRALTVCVGPCEHFRVPTASTLLAEELYAIADSGFLAALYDVQVPRGTASVQKWGVTQQGPAPFERKPHKLHPLGAFARKWLDDTRPWAREQLFAYLADGCDRAGHRTLVKRLYKGAEERDDHELLSRFFVAFDRMRRTQTRRRKVYDWQERVSVERIEEKLVKPRGQNAFHFSQRTRHYLQARIARYVRALGARDGAKYRRLVLDALALYRDTDFPSGSSLLRMRALVSTLFARSDVLTRRARATRLGTGKALAELAPQPLHTEVWRAGGAEILAALAKSGSLFVRRQLAIWLERDFASELETLDVTEVRRLIASPHTDVQLFGARALMRARGVENLLLEDWLALLETDNAEVLPLITQKMAEAVTPARASLEQCVALARHHAHAPAMLGVEWAERKSLTNKAELEAALPIVDATVREVRDRGFAWLTPALIDESLGLDAHLRELLDARHADIREKAFSLLDTTPGFRDSIVLWAALTESPHSDARAFLLSLLARRRVALESTQLGDKSLHHLWATTILEVNRGSRAKQRALTQLGERLESQPQQAEVLLPLLALALRSVREPERRGALSALVRTAVRQPEVRAAIARHAPELEVPSLAASVQPAPGAA